MYYLNRALKKPLYQQLYDAIKKQILDGDLPENIALQPVRVLAKELQVSRNTVDNAYQQLLEEGYIRAIQGSGFYVEDVSKNLFFQDYRSEESDTEKKNEEYLYDFDAFSVCSSNFMWYQWEKYIRHACAEEKSQRQIFYENNKGSYELRKAICVFIQNYRGVVCNPEQIVICPDTQYAVDIICQLLQRRNIRIAYEEPGDDWIRDVFSKWDCSIQTVPVREDGVHVEDLEETDCNMVYVTPSHQVPVGVIMSLERRIALLQWAYKCDAFIVENDYDSEFCSQRSILPSIQSLDRENRVFYVGSMAKSMLPSACCAFLVLPFPMIEIYEEKYKYFHAALPSYHQKAMANMIMDGVLEKHIRKLTIRNDRKYQLLKKGIELYMKEYVNMQYPPSGTHILVEIPMCQKEEKLLGWLQKYRIRIYGTKCYYYHKQNAIENQFMIGFGSLDEDKILAACETLGKALADYARR